MNTRPDIAVIGGGQLARMMQAPAIGMGVRLRLLAESTDSSAAQAIPDHVVGDYTDIEDLRTAAGSAPVVTFDHEHVPAEHMHTLESDGHRCRPGPDALLFAQDKAEMRQKLTALRIDVPDYDLVTTAGDVDRFAARTGGYPVVLKTARGGYDGKGVWVIGGGREAEELVADVSDDGTRVLLAEQLVDFRRELSVLVARRPSGECASYPVVETVQENGVCTRVIAPAPEMPGGLADRAEEIGRQIADDLGVTGIMAVELFETHDHRLLVNELAMRPHNTGHWTIEGAATSQFENHLRAVLDEPLGPTRCVAGAAVMVNVLGGRVDDLAHQRGRALEAEPATHVHLYGKQVRPGRKVGHVTSCSADLESARASAVRVADVIQNGSEGRA